MFPEYRDLITRLKADGSNTRFLSLFEKHNQLDHEILALEDHNASGIHSDIETLKKEKLHVKDELYALLRQEAAAGK
ncbi:MAG: DUF465 domain-containing protein [Burkholderiaceae bacterium]|jgi:uncharacterized protein YdcH (DUF465 family)|nr:DUF465 domain-containing protein [Burkholderiaceae bacterium]